MLRKFREKGVVLFSVLLVFASCIDNDYDLSKDMDLTVSVGGNAFVIPLGESDVTRLDSLLDESESLKLVDGVYSISKEDAIDDVNIDVDAVTIEIESPEIDPIKVELGENTKVKSFEVKPDPATVDVNIEDIKIENTEMPVIDALTNSASVISTLGGTVSNHIVEIKQSQEITVNVPKENFSAPGQDKDVESVQEVYFGNENGEQMAQFTINASDLVGKMPNSSNRIESLTITFPEEFTLLDENKNDIGNVFRKVNDAMGREAEKTYTFYIRKLKHEFDYNNSDYTAVVDFNLQYVVDGTFSANNSEGSVTAGVETITFDFDKALVQTTNVDAPFDEGTIAMESTVDGLDDVMYVRAVEFEDNTKLNFEISKMSALPLDFTSESKVKIELPQIFDLKNADFSNGVSYRNHSLLIPAQLLIGDGTLDVSLDFYGIDFTSENSGEGRAVNESGELLLNDNVSYYPVSEKEGQLTLLPGEFYTDELSDLKRSLNINVTCVTGASDMLEVNNSQVKARSVSSDIETETKLEVNEDMPEEVKALKKVELYSQNGNAKEPVKMRLSLDLSQLPSDIRELQFDPIKVALPKFIIFGETGTDKYTFKDDTLVIQDKYVSTDSKKEYLIELAVEGMDFSKIDAYKESGVVIENGVLSIPEDYTAVDITGTVRTADETVVNSNNFNDFDVNATVEIGKMYVGKVTGKVNPHIDEVEEEVDLDLGDDMDFLKDGTMVLSNPVIKVNMTNPVGADVNLKLRVAGYDENGNEIDGSAVEDSTDNPKYFGKEEQFKIYGANKSNLQPVTTHLFICKDTTGVGKLTSTDEDKYVYIEWDNLSDLMKTIPDKIKFQLIPMIDQNEDHYVDITPTFEEGGVQKARLKVDGDYKVSVPLSFDELNIEYTDTIGDLQEDMSDFLDVALSTHIEVVADFITSMPFDLKLNVEPQTADNLPLKNIVTSIEVNGSDEGIIYGTSDEQVPSSNNIRIILKANDKEELKQLDKLILKAGASITETKAGVPLRGDQTIQLKNIKVYIKKVNLDLN